VELWISSLDQHRHHDMASDGGVGPDTYVRCKCRESWGGRGVCSRAYVPPLLALNDLLHGRVCIRASYEIPFRCSGLVDTLYRLCFHLAAAGIDPGTNVRRPTCGVMKRWEEGVLLERQNKSAGGRFCVCVCVCNSS